MTASSSGASHVPSQPLAPSPRGIRSRDSGLPIHVMLWVLRETFLKACSRRTTVSSLRTNSCATLPKRGWNSTSYWWNLFSHWYDGLPEVHHLGNASWKSWKVNFETEAFSKTADPHLTMHWIIEVEIAKSIGELMTSRSTAGRHDFPDYDTFDAVIASALKSFSTRSHIFGKE